MSAEVEPELVNLNIVVVVIATVVMVENGLAVVVLMRCTRIPFQTKYQPHFQRALGAFV